MAMQVNPEAVRVLRMRHTATLDVTRRTIGPDTRPAM